MHYEIHCKRCYKYLILMKLTGLFLLIGILQVSATVHAQRISLSFEEAPLKEVMDEIAKQSGYHFLLNPKLVREVKPVTVTVVTDQIKEALDAVLDNQPLTYEIKGKEIILKAKPVAAKDRQQQDTIRGRVVDDNGIPLPDATIRIKGEKAEFKSDRHGNFEIPARYNNSTLQLVYIGYKSKESAVLKNGMIIVLSKSESVMDEVIVMGYGATSKRFNTGSIDKISADDIERQPVSNPLAALAGRIPGLIVTGTNGNPGSHYKVQIQGQNALAIGDNRHSVNSEPLYIIDGVPFAPNNDPVNQYNSAISNQSGLSPFSFINPADIQSIEVLKDADATAIYGSKGAYGVVLITTKKGTSLGQTRVNLNLSSGFSKVTRLMDFLNTEQYMEMRKEAFANDGVTPDETNAPDLFLWDQSKYTNWQKEFIGNTVNYTDAQLSVTGGSNSTQFLVSGSFQRQTLVYPGTKGNNKGGGHFNLNHRSENNKFNISLTTSYLHDKNETIGSDLTYISQMLPPNYPDLFDDLGKLVWEYNGTNLYYGNPLDITKTTYTANSSNLNSSLNLSYFVLPELNVKLTGGYNAVHVNEVFLGPIESQDPQYSPTGYSTLGNNAIRSWIIEPQAEYKKTFSDNQFSILLGSTFQKNWADRSFTTAYGYPSDDLLGSLAAATSYRLTSSNSDYKYTGVFTRINYSYKNKLIANLSGRRDGSSRFGKANQFGNFGAIGLAYIFSEETFFKSNADFLSFGKIRTSYGITGSDQIGNYQFMDTWKNTTNPYGTISGLYPTRLANPSFQWERNNKFSAALELGFLDDRLYLSTNYYNNISGNHLISTPLPYVTGFLNILENFPATVKNWGWEFLLSTKNIQNSNFSWITNFNLTLPKNKLASFPDFENSSYYATYIVGEPLNIIKGYHAKGVNLQTGVFEFDDLDGDGSFGSGDMINLGTLDPKYYGGLSNTINYKGISLTAFFEFKKQKGRNFIGNIYDSGLTPGFMRNFPTEVLSRWQKEGDITEIQRFIATYTTPAAEAAELMFRTNDAIYSDASYIRLKNVEVSYNLPNQALKSIHFHKIMLFARAQNLLTITNYKGTDPETQNINMLPPLRTVTFGISASL